MYVLYVFKSKPKPNISSKTDSSKRLIVPCPSRSGKKLGIRVIAVFSVCYAPLYRSSIVPTL